MIDLFYQNFSRNIQLFFLQLGLGKKKYKNFKDLNFKKNDFINYKIIKYYVLKENFINNLNIQDIHTFNFLFFYQKIGGKKGIELSKKIYSCGLKNLNIIKILLGALTMLQKDL